MGYGFLKRLTYILSSRATLEKRLEGAASLIKKAFPSDECSIYLVDPEKRRFTLKGFKGRSAGMVRSLGLDEGAAGEAGRKGTLVLVSGVSGKWRAARGMTGFKGVLAHPIKDGRGTIGVLLLKSKKGIRPGRTGEEVLGAAALLLASAVRAEESLKGLKRSSRSLKEAEERLRNSEKIMALGDIAAHLAHEIRNPLVSIGGFAMRARKHLDRESPALPYIESLVSEIGRVEKLVNGAVRFFREEELVLKPDDVNEILAETLSIFDDDVAARGIKVVKDLGEGPLQVMADREQLKIAFDNIIANAIQSMENGGTLTLQTAKKGALVVAGITDSGGGIDPKHLECIFNPFFTTKKNGTGLGLTITSAIVARHRGTIGVLNNLGVGATFEVKLPWAGGDKKENDGAGV